MADGPLSISHGPWSAGLGHHDGRLSVRWLRRGGVDLLSPEGCPLVGPWFGRLRDHRIAFHGVVADLDPDDPRIEHDDLGRPLHGLRTRPEDWHLSSPDPSRALASTTGLSGPAFPFPHEIVVEASVSEAGLEVTTALSPTGSLPVPVAFGWHPYLVAGGGDPGRWTVRLPFDRQVVLADLLPTSQTATVELAEDVVRPRDDCYLARPGDSAMIVGSTGSTEIELASGYGWAMVWSPEGADFVCVEPMAGPLLALEESSGATVVAPGGSFRCTFRIR
jgi:aldose 1-epimerase